MAQILIRNLDEEIKDRLRFLAARHHRSLEAEVREVLRSAVMDDLPKSEAPAATIQPVR